MSPLVRLLRSVKEWKLLMSRSSFVQPDTCLFSSVKSSLLSCCSLLSSYSTSSAHFASHPLFTTLFMYPLSILLLYLASLTSHGTLIQLHLTCMSAASPSQCVGQGNEGFVRLVSPLICLFLSHQRLCSQSVQIRWCQLDQPPAEKSWPRLFCNLSIIVSHTLSHYLYLFRLEMNEMFLIESSK